MNHSPILEIVNLIGVSDAYKLRWWKRSMGKTYRNKSIENKIFQKVFEKGPIIHWNRYSKVKGEQYITALSNIRNHIIMEMGRG